MEPAWAQNAEELKRYINNDSNDKLSIIDFGGFDSTMNRITIITAYLVITPVSDKSFEDILSQLSELIVGELKVKV